jgi:hypothetical protein
VPSRPRWRDLARRLGFAAAALVGAACVRDQAIVELAWSFVDRDGASIFPSGELSDLCDLRGELGGQERSYALHLELRLCDPECPGGCALEACWITEPLRFGCASTRGSSLIPVKDGPTIFDVQVVAAVDGAPECACAIASPCAERPGPRARVVEPGLVTDLQVYLLVLDLPDPDSARLDLSTCCEVPPTCG